VSSQEVPEAVFSEGCLGAIIGVGLSSARSLEVTETVLGASEDGCPVEVGSSPVAVLSKDFELSIPVSVQTTSVVPYSLGRDREDSAPILAEVGFLRRGFFGPRIPSPTSSSLASKVVPVKEKGLENSMICRGFFGPSFASPKILSSAQNPSEASVLAHSWRVKEKVAKQLHKNKELLAESVGVTQVGTKGYSKAVLDL
jgi:hypothetical protein